jgi:hypothetical protein
MRLEDSPWFGYAPRILVTDQAQEIPMHRERPVISESPDELKALLKWIRWNRSWLSVSMPATPTHTAC